MYSLNRAQIIGNLTRDPELRTTASGQSVVNFGVATNRQFKDASGAKQEQVEFHNVVAWGKLADICSQYLGKGRKVFLEGRLQTREWEGQDGNKRKSTEIVADNMIMLDKSGAPASGGGESFSAASAGAPATMPAPTPAPIDEIQVEDIPF
ncbi:single-stranded DNA-binding protein [Candidatus Uhrbacteria bacterium]|jgi:single-strand DNA-binding protein|nr:single-stranded DNA-binding protein [Candidatus Uhrbacteria bacterium]